MKELINEYLTWKGTYARRASVNYRIWLDRFLEVSGNKQLHEYLIADFVKYQNWLEARFGSYSVQFATIVIKNFLQYCKMQNYQCISPTLIRLARVNAKSHRAITEGEFHKITVGIPQHDFISLRNLLLIKMLWDTGVRVSELCDLDISQINEDKQSAVIQTKKNGKNRIIVWSQETHHLLIKYIVLRRNLRHQISASALFVGKSRGRGWSLRLTPRSVQRFIKDYAEGAGIKEKITPHSFRHGWAHKRRDQNAPLAFIQRGLGHNNPVSTFIYEQYNDKEFERSANSYLQAA